MCLQSKTWNFIGKPPHWSLTFTQECSLFSMEKFLFCGWPTLEWSHLFSKLASSNYKSLASQVILNVNCVGLSVELTLLGFPHTVIGRLWSGNKSSHKSKFRDGLFNKSSVESWTPCHTLILLSPIITRINLETCIIIQIRKSNCHQQFRCFYVGR